MTYKISYPQKWSKDGTHYNQMISAKLTVGEIIRFYYLGDSTWREYDENTGIYFPKLTERDVFVRHFEIKDKRLLDRNTCIKISVA